MNAHHRMKARNVATKWDAKTKAPRGSDQERQKRPDWMRPASKCKLYQRKRRLNAADLETI